MAPEGDVSQIMNAIGHGSRVFARDDTEKKVGLVLQWH
jgi:hypothetical protein